ncbi:hypothetical protein C8Q80DRAFT_1117177 [Daedaleopsis nitida]|nr:hypothetical protein C8Q80DRAFT_1117177 [Daedaleopsis nitida]
MSHPSPSASLVSLSSTAEDVSTTPHASTTNLIAPGATSPKSSPASHNGPTAPTPASKVVKDYESAFAALSSSYGWSGHVPTNTVKSTSSTVGKKDKDKKKRTQGAASTKSGESNARS